MLTRVLQGPKLLDVVIVAHSSGTFVAHELLGQLLGLGSSSPFANQVRYFNLDGGQSGMTSTIMERVILKCHFVYANDSLTGSVPSLAFQTAS